MRNPAPLDVAEHKAGLACSLWETILDKACKECSPVLVDLLSLVCDINQEVHQSLVFSQGGGRHGQSDNDNPEPCRERAVDQRERNGGTEHVD